MPRHCMRCDSPLYETERFVCSNCSIELANPIVVECDQCGGILDDHGQVMVCSNCGCEAELGGVSEDV